MSERIRRAQEGIGLALLKARAEEDRELARTVREQGERLAHINYGLLQLTRIHAVSNSAFDHPVAEFARIVSELVALLGPVHLVCVEGQIYVNDVRVRFETHPEHATAFGKLLAQHAVGGITYHAALGDDEVRTMVALFASPAAAAEPRRGLEAQLADVGITTIELHALFRYREEAEALGRPSDEVFADAASALEEAFANLAAGRLINPLPIRRTVIDMLEATSDGDLVGAVHLAEDHLPAFARHPITVTALSLAVTRELALPITVSAHIGVAAMLHDAGYAAGVRSPVPYSAHGRSALRVLLSQRGFHEARVTRLLTVLEHHLPFGRGRHVPSLPARIVHITDDFDRLTRTRSNRPAPATPPGAIRHMLAAAETQYDPVLLQAFVNAVGPYPPGSWLRLADGRTVVVTSGVRDPATFERPLCRLIDSRSGRPGAEIDLAHGGRVASVVARRA